MKLRPSVPAVRCPESPPARGRGLKQQMRAMVLNVKMSPPARGRGLKPGLVVNDLGADMSPPARGRGLKPRPVFTIPTHICRPPRGGVD